jgi:dihydrodipicolinate synthase/N-acetylneuraminate lyase
VSLPKRFRACVLATAVVPWTAEGQVDEALFRDEIRAMLHADFKQLYVFGTAGEGYAVGDAQFEHITRLFVDEMRAGAAEPMVGVISLSLATILNRIAVAHERLGVNLFQISLPGWGALEASEVRSFFDEVLGRFADCQFLHYNLLRTKRLVTAAEYARIAADHPNLVATKNSTDSMTRIRELIDGAPMLQHFLNERGFAYGSMIGECGLLASVATLNWRLGLRYFQMGNRRNVDELLRMEADLSRIGAAFVECVSGGAIHIDGAFDKALYRLHEPRFPLALLAPYEGVEPTNVDRFGEWLRERYPQWVPEA